MLNEFQKVKGRGGLLNSAGIARSVEAGFALMAPAFHYDVQCFDENGDLKWEDGFDNLVTNAGRDDLVNKYFKGSSYTAAWYVGIIEDTSFSAYANADTLASHAGWTECTAYSGSRKAATFGSSSGTTTVSLDNSGSPAAFAINATKTVKGCFLCTASSGTSGVLYSAGGFTGGDRSVVNGDTLNVTVTLTQS
jgi:hypothetical protein